MKNKRTNMPVKSKIVQLLIYFLILGWFPAISQSEIESDSSAASQDTILKYITPLEYAFMMHEETSWLLKGGIILENTYNGRITFKLGFEKRIAPSFTMNLLLNNLIYEEIPDRPRGFTGGFQSSLESRWYYRLNKRIKKNEVARNMSDNYFAFGIGYTHFFISNSDFFDDNSDVKSLALFLKWGLQRRFLKWGHADIGFKAGLSNELNNYFSPTFIFGTNVDLGLGITKDKYKLNREKLCPVLKCFEAENYAFKSNLSGLFNIGLYQHGLNLRFVPHIAYERKIGKSPFSVNTEIMAIFGYQRRNINYKERSYGSENYYLRAYLDIEGRWYYNLKRRILKGKAGNGLSASYLATGGRIKYNQAKKWYGHEGEFTPSVYIVTGWQQLFSEHMYYDINLGWNFEFDSNGFTSDEFIFKFAVGYKF